MLRLTAILSKGDSKKLLNQYIKQLSSQLNHIKIQAKLDKRELKTEINSALNNVSFKDIEMGVSENKTKLKVKKVIADAKKTVQNNPISLDISLKKEKLNNQLTTYLAKNTKIKESSVLLKEAEKVRDTITQVDDSKSFRTASNSFQLYKSSVQAAGYQTKSTTDKVKGLIGKITKVGSLFGLASTAINKFTESINTIKINDGILTEISKVSNMTKGQLSELGLSSFPKASKYGRLSSDYLTATQEMSRSGFYSEKGEGMAEQSLLAQAAGNMTADVANDYILATNAAYKFNGEASKINEALDGMNSITNRNSAEMTDMATAMTKAGTVAAGYRVSIEDLSAMIGTIESVTKAEGSEVGNSIKTLLINLQNVTSDKIVDTLKEAKASMTETVDGVEKLRNPINILRDLAKTYNELDEDDPLRAKIVTNIGSKYHATKLSALLQNMDMFDKMLVDYSEGSGSAMEEAEKSANSLQGRLNTLQNSWDSLVVSFANSDTLKGGVSFLNGILNSAEMLIDTIGAIPLAITALSGAMTALNKEYGITQIRNAETGKFDVQGNIFGIDITAIKQQKKHFAEAEEAIADWNVELSNGVTDIASFNNETVKNNAHLKDYLKTCSSDAPASLQGYQSYLRATGVSTDALRLRTILLNSAIGMGIGFAIQGAISGISYLINYEEKQQEAFENAKTATEESAKAIRDIKSEMSDTSTKASELSSEFAKLVQGVNPFTNQNEKLSTEQYEKFLDVNNQLAELFPSLTRNYDENGNAILGLSGDVDSVTESIAKLIEQQNNLAKADMRDKLDEYVNGTDDSEGVFTALEGYKKDVEDAENELNSLKGTYDSIMNGTGKKYFNPNNFELNDYIASVKDQLGTEAVTALQKSITVDEVGGWVIDFSKIELDESTKGKITESYNTFYQDLQTDLSVKKSELEAKNQEMSNMMMVWIEDIDLYKNGDPAFKKAIESMVGSIQWSDLDVEEGNIGEAKQLVQSLVIAPISKACNDPDAKLQVINAINNLFSLDFSKLSYEEANEKIKEFLTKIMNAMNKGVPEEQKKSLDDMYNMFNLTEYKDSADKMKNSLSSIAKEGSTDYKKLENYTKSFTQQQTEAWLSATNGAKNAEDAINKYETSLKAASNNNPKMTFDKAWDSIGKETKQKLLDAAYSSELTGQKIRDLAKDDEKLNKAFEATGMSAKEFAKSIREISIEKANNEINEYENALQKIKKGSSLTAEETATLIAKNDSLAGSIKKTKDGYKIEKDALLSVLNASKQKYNVVVANEILETNKVIESVNKRIDAYKAELKAVQTAMEARQTEYDSIINSGEYEGKEDDVSRAIFGNTQATMDYTASIELPEKIKKDEKKLKGLRKTLKQLEKSLKKVSGSSSGSKKDKGTKNTKQEIDWIERRVNRLTSKISLLNAQKENLFSVKNKNSNLNKQLSYTTKLIDTYTSAVAKYNKKANSIKLSSSLKKLVQNGKISGSYNSLVKKYGEKTATRIQNYQNWYDKSKSAKQSLAEAKSQKRELQVQKNQNYVDLYNSRISRAEAKGSVSIGAKAKNDTVDTQIKNTKLSYQYQIKIAKLNKNKAEADKLEYEMQKKITELKLQQIQNLQQDYENQIGLVENSMQDINNRVSLVQARGQIVTASYYHDLSKQQTSKRALAVDEQKKIQKELDESIKNGSIKIGSDEWYEVQSTLQDLDNTISECDVTIAENTNSIRKIHSDMQEAMAENANRMNSEADFLANLLSRNELTDSDTGTLTNAGLATLGTYGINLETAQEQMRELNKERAILEEMKKKGILDYGDNGKHKYNSLEQLEEAYDDIISKQQEWTQNEFESEQRVIDLMKEYYQTQLDYLKKIIDAKKKVIDLQADLYSYQKTIAEKTRDIATLEKQAAALKGDTSEQGRAKLSQIQISLDDASQSLQDFEYDRYVSEQQNMLDNLYSEYEDLMQNLFKNTDALLKDGIAAINNNATLIKGILDKTAEDYGYDYSGNFSDIINAFGANTPIVTGIKESINGDNSSISSKLDVQNKYLQEKYEGSQNGNSSSNNNVSSTEQTGTATSSQNFTINKDDIYSPKLYNDDYQETMTAIQPYLNSDAKNPKSDLNKLIKKHSNYVISNKNNDADFKKLAKKLGVSTKVDYTKNGAVYKYLKSHGFRKGGIVRADGVPLDGDNVPIRVNPNETVLTEKFTDELPNAVKTMDEFVKVKESDKGSWVTVEQQKLLANAEPFTSNSDLLANAVPYTPPFNLLPDVKPPTIKQDSLTKQNLGSQNFGDINVSIELPNVSDYKSFCDEMKNSAASKRMFVRCFNECARNGRIGSRINL